MASLSIVVPVFNEENAILQTIQGLEAYYSKFPDLEIIFVNDGSTDNTLQILESSVSPETQIINHSHNKGYGAALKTGLNKAKGDCIAITDADASYPHEKIEVLLDRLLSEDIDMAVGARQGKISASGLFRKFPKFLLKKLAEYLSNEKIPDFNSGLRVIRRKPLLSALRYLPDGFSFTTTLTLFLLSNNGRITYIPIDYYRRKGKSKIRPFRDTMNFVQLIIRTIMFFNPLKVFLPLSAFFIIMSFLVLIVSYFMGRVLDITTVLLFVTGLNFLAIGLLADLIDKRLSK
jgi:glycosyltransferase involved in cell wall biosynthesis